MSDAWLYDLPDDQFWTVVCPPIKPPRTITHREPIGCLDLLREELRVGVRTRTTFDALYRAAVCEQNGLDAKRDGLHLAASDWFSKAEQIILEAAKRKGLSRARRAEAA